MTRTWVITRNMKIALLTVLLLSKLLIIAFNKVFTLSDHAARKSGTQGEIPNRLLQCSHKRLGHPAAKPHLTWPGRNSFSQYTFMAIVRGYSTPLSVSR